MKAKDDSMLENWENNSLMNSNLNGNESVLEKGSETKTERWTSCNTSGINNTFFLCSETEKILDALESDTTKGNHGFFSPPTSRLTILDLSKLDDSLLTDTPNIKKYRSDGIEDLREVPSMSTPKTCEEVIKSSARNECRVNLNFDINTNETTPSPKLQEATFTSKEEAPTSSQNPPRTNAAQIPPINTTFDKESNEKEAAEVPKFNVTFEAEALPEDNLNRTFEVVGNGSFIIEGKCTNLMDMESEALHTVLGSATNTPSRGIRSYPDTKKLSKSTLKKRLSMLTSNGQGDLNNENGDNQNTKLDSRNALGLLTKEQVLSRLRKKNNAASAIGNNGPLKAVPLKKIEDLKKRATSTPTGKLRNIQKTQLSDSNNSEEKELVRLPSLPSFGSVSSIGTDGLNSRDVASDEFMATPEVFRHRSKIEGPQVTSTPSLMPCSLKFETLGFGAAPTPIVAPDKNVKAPCITTNNCSYVVENPKVKSRLSFSTASKENSPNSDVVHEDIDVKQPHDAVKLEVALLEAVNKVDLNEDCEHNRDHERIDSETLKEDCEKILTAGEKEHIEDNKRFDSESLKEDCEEILAEGEKEVGQTVNTIEMKDDGQTAISEKLSDECGRLDAEELKESCTEGLIKEEVKILDSGSVFDSTAKEVKVETGPASVFDPDNDLVSRIVDEHVVVLTSTAEVDSLANGVKASINNLSSIKECDLDKELKTIDLINVKAASPDRICCQCGNTKNLNSEDNNEKKRVNQEFLKTTSVEISGIQNLSSNANEIIEAYEEMCRPEMPNFTNDFNDTKTEMKCQTSVNVSSSLKNLSQDTSRNLTTDVTSGSSKNIVKSTVRRSVSAPKLSAIGGISSKTPTDNSNLKTQGSGRRLNTLPPKPPTQKPTPNRRDSLVKAKRESLPSSRPTLKSINTGNMPTTTRRTTLQMNLAPNSQTNKSEAKALPPKPVPKVRTAVHARTFPEAKSLPPKPKLPPKPLNKPAPLTSKPLLQSIENNKSKPDSNQILSKVSTNTAQSTINRNRISRAQSPKVPNIHTGVKTTSSPNVSGTSTSADIKSTFTRSKLNYSSSNKENTQLHSMRKTSIGASVRSPSTSIRPPNTSIRPPNTSIRPPNTSIRPPNTSIRLPSTCIRLPNTSIRLPNTSIRPPSTSIRPPSGLVKPQGSGIRPPSGLNRLQSSIRPPNERTSMPLPHGVK